jgi:hypothetical protein
MASLNRHIYGRKCLVALVALVSFAASARVVSAGTITLSDLNSNITIDPSKSGITVWGVDTSSYPDNQELLYRIGPSGTAQPGSTPVVRHLTPGETATTTRR